jgi:acetylornithine deacetylase/succinyl-diaminopimelate desuccinylase-like protein
MVTVALYGLEADDWSALEREVVDLFTALLRVDTTNPPGNETACALVLKDYLAGNGIESALVGELPARQNLVARLDGARRGPSLTFMGHTDVVPADAAEWSVPPFAGVVKDGYVWGCGATDMKNQVAAEAVALARLKRSGADFAGTVKYAATVDEEDGDHCGVRWLCRNEPDTLRAEYLINEGMGGLWLPVDGAKVFLLAAAEKAFAQFRIRTRGRGGHASVPEKEHSAVIDLARAVVALGLYDPPAIVAPLTAQFIDAVVSDADLRARLKDPQTARAAGAELRRLDAEIASLVEPLLGATFTPTMLDAGKAVNVIPTHAEACIDCRILPEMTAADTRELVAAVLDPLGIDWEFEWVDVTTPNASPAPTALSESIARVLRRDVPDAVLAPMCSGSFTDSRWIREHFPDCIAYGFAPFVAESLHAMQGGRDHEPDERIRVEDVTYQALFFERLARDLLA